VMITYVRFAERTIVDLVDTAKDNQGMLFWFQSLLPWLLIGIGAVLLIIGAGLMIRKQRTA